ncbi:MAG: hypothetical protein EON93_26375, partial [Burkholderiales bacterium]
MLNYREALLGGDGAVRCAVFGKSGMAVGSVVNAIAILRQLASSEESHGVIAISRNLGLSQSSCHNILKTLVEERLLTFNQATKKYRISDHFDEQIRSSPAGQLADRARPLLKALADEFQLVSGFWEVHGARVRLKAVLHADVPIRIHMTEGQRLPRHVGALGRCLATADNIARKELGDVIARLRWQSPPTVENYAREMVRARADGWARDEGNYIRGVVTVATAVSLGASPPLACLTASM